MKHISYFLRKMYPFFFAFLVFIFPLFSFANYFYNVDNTVQTSQRPFAGHGTFYLQDFDGEISDIKIDVFSVPVLAGHTLKVYDRFWNFLYSSDEVSFSVSEAGIHTMSFHFEDFISNGTRDTFGDYGSSYLLQLEPNGTNYNAVLLNDTGAYYPSTSVPNLPTPEQQFFYFHGNSGPEFFNLSAEVIGIGEEAPPQYNQSFLSEWIEPSSYLGNVNSPTDYSLIYFSAGEGYDRIVIDLLPYANNDFSFPSESLDIVSSGWVTISSTTPDWASHGSYQLRAMMIDDDNLLPDRVLLGSILGNVASIDPTLIFGSGLIGSAVVCPWEDNDTFGIKCGFFHSFRYLFIPDENVVNLFKDLPKTVAKISLVSVGNDLGGRLLTLFSDLGSGLTQTVPDDISFSVPIGNSSVDVPIFSPTKAVHFMGSSTVSLFRSILSSLLWISLLFWLWHKIMTMFYRD